MTDEVEQGALYLQAPWTAHQQQRCPVCALGQATAVRLEAQWLGNARAISNAYISYSHRLQSKLKTATAGNMR